MNRDILYGGSLLVEGGPSSSAVALGAKRGFRRSGHSAEGGLGGLRGQGDARLLGRISRRRRCLRIKKTGS